MRVYTFRALSPHQSMSLHFLNIALNKKQPDYLNQAVLERRVYISTIFCISSKICR